MGVNKHKRRKQKRRLSPRKQARVANAKNRSVSYGRNVNDQVTVRRAAKLGKCQQAQQTNAAAAADQEGKKTVSCRPRQSASA